MSSLFAFPGQGAQHIAFLCPTTPGKPRMGALVDLTRDGDEAARRFSEEARRMVETGAGRRKDTP